MSSYWSQLAIVSWAWIWVLLVYFFVRKDSAWIYFYVHILFTLLYDQPPRNSWEMILFLLLASPSNLLQHHPVYSVYIITIFIVFMFFLFFWLCFSNTELNSTECILKIIGNIQFLECIYTWKCLYLLFNGFLSHIMAYH